MLTNKLELYQYKPLRTLEHLHWLKNYMNQKVWFSLPAQLNDPFECNFFFSASHEEIIKDLILYKRLLAEAISEGIVKNKDEFDTILKQSSSKIFVDNFYKNNGILCLTRESSNIPMWSHYADNHQGYCIIYELDFEEIYKIASQQIDNEFISNVIEGKEILSFTNREKQKEFNFTKVVYEENLPKIDEDEIKKLNIENKHEQYEYVKYFIQNSIGVKFKQWEYEQEYRLILNAKGLMDFRWCSFFKITGLILGEKFGKNLNECAINFIRTTDLHTNNLLSENKIEEKLKKYILDIAKEKELKVYAAKTSVKEYKINWKDNCLV